MTNSNSAEARPVRGRKSTSLKTLRTVIDVRAPPEGVFDWLDEPLNAGSHMQGGGMGVRLKLGIRTENRTGVGAMHRWHGKAMGLTVDYTTVVSTWVRNREKAYHTVGNPKIVIMSGFEMRWVLDSIEHGTRIGIDFGYRPPRSWLGRFLHALVGRRYGEWCLNMIMGDAETALGAFPSRATRSRKPAFPAAPARGR